MTLTAARDHPWLADQRTIHGTNPEAPVIVSRDESVELLPETQEDSQALSTSFDISMRSLASSGRFAPDGTSAATHQESQAETPEEPSAASEGSSRAATPAHVAAESNSSFRCVPGP